MEHWSNEKMREKGEGRSTMPGGTGPVLDAQTAALVRVATAVARGQVPQLKARFAAARDARVPGLWIEELLLQSMLVVGYPLALVAFGVWRGVGGPAPVVGGAWGSGVPRGVRTRVSQTAREPARAAPGARRPGPGGCLRQGDRATGPRSQAARALHGSDHGGARHRRAAALALAGSVEHGGGAEGNRGAA